MRNCVVNQLEQIAEDNRDIVVFTADLGYSVFEGFAKKFPDRFVNTGIAEAVMTSAAAGMALNGKTVITYSIANFNTLRVIEQIRNDICYHNAHVIIISVGGGVSYGQLGMSHHATEDISMMSTLPNMKVFVPGTPDEAEICLNYAIKSQGPSYIRLARRGEKNLYKIDKAEDGLFEVKTHENSKYAILSCGPILNEALKAEEILRGNDIDIDVYSIPFVKPLSKKIYNILKKYKVVFTLEENQKHGGLGGWICEERCKLVGNACRVIPFGFNDEFTSVVGSHDFLCEKYKLSAQYIAKNIIDIDSGK